MENRVVALKCSMDIKRDWPEPFFLARVFRYWNRFQKSVTDKLDKGMKYFHALDQGSARSFTPEHMKRDPESRPTAHASGKYPQYRRESPQASYRDSLESLFGVGYHVDSILHNIQEFEQNM